MEIVFATHNQHKTEGVRAILGADYRILNLPELGCPDIPETADTLKGNALQKAQYVADHYGRNCFADDTGLEVLALDGRPGVYSARYAGEGCSYQDNVLKLLGEMQGVTDRRACFKTVIALILNGKTYFFEGRVDGIILPEQRGTDGFGYDPVFLPDGYDQTFAEMDAATKNSISHRGRAMRQLQEFLMRREK
jgi:XTP/dITP diphosphohydrolase